MLKRPTATRRNSTLSLLLVILLVSCSDDHREPGNVISDRSGLSIDLAWSTNGSIASALSQADLDLDVYKDDGEILSSYNTHEFEHVDFTEIPGDGVFTVKISAYEISEESNYTLKISGVAKNKTFLVSGNLKRNSPSEVSVVKIVKKGDQFTLAQL